MTDREKLDQLAAVIFDAHYDHATAPFIKRMIYGDEHASFAELKAMIAGGTMNPIALEEFYRVAAALLAKFPGLHDRLH